jgi:hypothetical protein
MLLLPLLLFCLVEKHSTDTNIYTHTNISLYEYTRVHFTPMNISERLS